MSKKSLYVIAMAAHGFGLSGGDRIFIEIAKRLRKKLNVNVFVWEEGVEMCRRQSLYSGRNIRLWTWKMRGICKYGFVICYLGRIFKSIEESISLIIKNPQSSIVYSASEFWMDSLPAFIIKIRYPKIKWVAAWFQTAPKPWQGFSEGKREETYKVNAFFYWLVQVPIKPLISRYANFILVNNESEKKNFSEPFVKRKLIVILGGVNVEDIKKYMLNHTKKSKESFDAVFQGRFHPQKGIGELIDIWKMVVIKKPQAKLAVIGDGPLMSQVKSKIKNLGLGNNIHLFGYLFDGRKKYEIFSNSKIVCHPAFYDSGGMASAEAMAFGIPAVAFDLSAYESYYPDGLIKVEVGNLKEFSKAIIKLLDDRKLRVRLGKQAQRMIENEWSWDNRIDKVFKVVNT